MPTTSRVPAVARGRKPRGAFIALRTPARRSVEVAATARTQPLPPAKRPFAAQVRPPKGDGRAPNEGRQRRDPVGGYEPSLFRHEWNFE